MILNLDDLQARDQGQADGAEQPVNMARGMKGCPREMTGFAWDFKLRSQEAHLEGVGIARRAQFKGTPGYKNKVDFH